MKELEGFHIPDIQPTKDSTCAGDPAAAANAAKNGWWTCGGYTRSTGPTSYLVDVILGSSSFLLQILLHARTSLTGVSRKNGFQFRLLQVDSLFKVLTMDLPLIVGFLSLIIFSRFDCISSAPSVRFGRSILQISSKTSL